MESFATISILQGIHRAIYYLPLSDKSFDDGIQFIELLTQKYKVLFKKKCVQIAFERSICKAIKRNRSHIVKYLQTGSLLPLLKRSVLIKIFVFSILIHHKSFDEMLMILKGQYPSLLSQKKIRKALSHSLLRARQKKRQPIIQALVEFS